MKPWKMNSIAIWIAQHTLRDFQWEAGNWLTVNWVVLVMMNARWHISLNWVYHHNQRLYRDSEERYNRSVETTAYLLCIFNQTPVILWASFEFSDWTCLVWMLNLMNPSSSLLLFWDPIRCTYPTQSCGCRPECVCLSKGKRRGRNTQWFLPANTLHWAWCISIRAVTNNAGCRYVSQHQRETSAKVVSSFIDPVWNQQLPQRNTERRTKE